MRRFIRVALIVLAGVLIGLGILAYRLLSHPSLAPYASLELRSTALATDRLAARFFGTTTIVLDDGETAIMTDGFFSRPGKWQLLTGKISPDAARIDHALSRANVGRLAAVLVAHSHYDHAMDSAAVAKRTGALLIGSESTANIGRGEAFPEDRIRVVAGGESFTFGRFKVTIFKSPHSPGALFEGEITGPLHTPARGSAYREGGNYSFLVEHGGRGILIHPSANFIRGIFKTARADIVFLGVGVLGKQSDQFAEDYWREVVQATGARLVLPIHWDDFTLPLDQPLTPMPPLMDEFDRGMQMVQRMAKRDAVAVRLMPLFESVDLLAAMGN
jgi:L-ascorbate metabolism protein UlaG (beta-lactamase superfamily)